MVVCVAIFKKIWRQFTIFYGSRSKSIGELGQCNVKLCHTQRRTKYVFFFAYAAGYSDGDSEMDDETQCHVNLSVNSSN